MITTYAKLIQGLSLSITICDSLAKKAHKNGDLETKRFYEKESQAHFETLSRYSMMRSIIGDEVAVVA